MKKGFWAAGALLVSSCVCALYLNGGSAFSARAEGSTLSVEPLEVLSYKTILADRSGTELVSDASLIAKLREFPAERRVGPECTDDAIAKNPKRCLGLVVLSKYTQIAEKFEGFKDRKLLQMFESRKLQALVGSPDDFEGGYRTGNAEHIPSEELVQSLPLSSLCSMNKDTWAKAIAGAKRLVQESDSKVWTVNGLPFAAGNFLVKGYLRSVPLHGQADSAGGDPTIDRDVLVIEKYENHSVVYHAELWVIDGETKADIKDVRVSSPYALTSQKQDDGSVLRRVGGFGLFQQNKLELFQLGPNAASLKDLAPFSRQLAVDEANQLGAVAHRFFKCLTSLNKALAQ